MAAIAAGRICAVAMAVRGNSFYSLFKRKPACGFDPGRVSGSRGHQACAEDASKQQAFPAVQMPAVQMSLPF
jgi:hypothetical protein